VAAQSAEARAALSADLRRHAPFAQMPQACFEALLEKSRVCTYRNGERVLDPAMGNAERLRWIRRGTIGAHHSGTDGDSAVGDAFQREAGELFPVGAVWERRPVTFVYEAVGDVECVEFDAEGVHAAARSDAALAGFMAHGAQHFADLARRALHAATTSQALAEQSLEAPLSSLPRTAPVAVGPQATLADGLLLMQARDVGSVLVLDAESRALGILTRHDLLPKLALREPPLDIRATPIAQVMSQPVITLDVGQRVHEAALAMARHGIRHLPLTEAGRVVSLVSERDLFALQRLSLRQLSASLRRAPDAQALRILAPRIREFARQMLAQGLAARPLTELVSHLNDVLTQRLVALAAHSHGLDLKRACWLAFGSEGRGEQTISTDQDNGLVLADDAGDAERARWLRMAGEVNADLDACGYPLCKGGIMAGQEACCLRQRDWLERFRRWIAQGQPEDLLNASIYFDLRALAGHGELAAPLRALFLEQAPTHPRFLRLLAENSLRLRPALNWLGALDTDNDALGHWLDLKLHGTAVFVDAARLFVLAHGLDEIGTRARLEQGARAMGAGALDGDTWASAFEVLQMLRLRIQVDPATADSNQPNRIDVRGLNEIDRRLLKESMRVARRLQQRITMDWLRQ
jgi:CBS domain-containing protein